MAEGRCRGPRFASVANKKGVSNESRRDRFDASLRKSACEAGQPRFCGAPPQGPARRPQADPGPRRAASPKCKAPQGARSLGDEPHCGDIHGAELRVDITGRYTNYEFTLPEEGLA